MLRLMLRSACPLLVALGLNGCGRDAAAPMPLALESQVVEAGIIPQMAMQSSKSSSPSPTLAIDDALERVVPVLGVQGSPLTPALTALRDAIANSKASSSEPLLANAGQILTALEATMDAEAQPDLDAVRLALSSIAQTGKKSTGK